MKNIFAVLVSILAVFLHTGCSESPRVNDEYPQGVIIVANKSGDDVHFIDSHTGDLLLVLPAGQEPHEVAVSDDGSIAVVCNYGNGQNPGNTLSVYDIAQGSLFHTIDLGEHTFPHGMQWMPGSSFLLVTAEGSNSLLIVNIMTAEVVQAFDTGQEVSHMVVATPDMSRAFVPGIRTGNVAVIDLHTGELLEHIYSGEGAEGIDATPDGQHVWVTNRAENTISIINTQTLEVEQKISCEDFPIRGKFSPDGNLFLVSNARSGDVAVFDVPQRVLKKKIVLTTPPLPEGEDSQRYFSDFEDTSVPIGIVIPNNKVAYVANTRSDAITVIDLVNLEISGHFMAGKEPDGISFSEVSPGVN